MRSSLDIQLAAYDVLDTAIAAESYLAAVAAVRADLEVLPRDELLRVAVVLAVEPARRLVPRADRPRFQQRMQRARLKGMWEGS